MLLSIIQLMLPSKQLAFVLSFFVHPARLFKDTTQFLLLVKFEQLLGRSGAEATSLIGFTTVFDPIKLQFKLPLA